MKKESTRPLFLKSLSLKNFATFDDSFVEFDQYFNVIAGETGSGKSLILDALCLILGQRADKKLIRKGNEFLIVEAVFHCDDKEIFKFFDEMGYPVIDNELIVKRIVYSTGKSKNYINYGQCNLNDLVVFSKRFIDIVGQFENQKLLSEKYQLVLIDKYGNLEHDLKDYQESYELYKKVTSDIKQLEKKQDDIQRELDYIDYQLSELDALDPDVEVEASLLEKKDFIVNFEKRHELFSGLQSLMNEEQGILDIFSIFYKKVIQNEKLLPNFNVDDLNLVNDKLEEFSSYLSTGIDTEIDTDDFETIIDQLDKYQKLKSKHKTDTLGLVELRESLRTKKNNLENSEANFASLQQKQKEYLQVIKTKANALHAKRVRVSSKLSEQLTKALQALNMVGSTLRIEIVKTDSFSPTGLDTVNIIAETNRGEGFYEIKKIASGGELSRILLAFRQVLSSKDTISIFLFDEIDTGIGGETALKIGNSLKVVSSSSQVVAITHLPQIASYGSKVINVMKKFNSSQERTFSYVEEISGLQNIRKFSKAMSPISQELQ